MPTLRPRPRYRCRFCGTTFSAWIPVPGEPDGALLLGHIRQSHPGELTPLLDQRHTDDDITPATLQAYEVVEEGHASARQGRARGTLETRDPDASQGLSRVRGASRSCNLRQMCG